MVSGHSGSAQIKQLQSMPTASLSREIDRLSKLLYTTEPWEPRGQVSKLISQCWVHVYE